MSRRKPRVWLHPDSGLEGASGCLRLIFTGLVILAMGSLLLCLLGALFGSGYKFLTCTFGGDC